LETLQKTEAEKCEIIVAHIEYPSYNVMRGLRNLQKMTLA